MRHEIRRVDVYTLFAQATHDVVGYAIFRIGYNCGRAVVY
jgi:hypothetical protein